MPSATIRTNWKGLLHLFVVYLVWSSTYLAIRVAVRPEGGFPPFAFGALRVILGGLVLLLWARLAGQRIRLSGREMLVLAGSGLLLWTGGNGFLMWAEQRIASGYAALLVASTPIWVAILESVLDRKLPTFLLVLFLLTGFAGTGLLSVPSLCSGQAAEVLPVLALMLGSFCWGAGSLLHHRNPLEVSSRVSAAYQQLFGCGGFLLMSLVSREPLPRPTLAAWWALAYLLLFGSILAYTSYLRALELLPTRIVFTYAYVNPVLAVFLGWLFLQEPVTGWTMAGAMLVLMGVAGVFRARSRH